MAKKNPLAKFTPVQFQREVKRRAKQSDALVAKRRKLAEQLSAIDVDLKAAGIDPSSIVAPAKKTRRKSKASATPSKPRAPKEGGTLAEALTKVMSSTKPMSVAQISADVLAKTEYKTKQRDAVKFQPMVTQGIKNNPDLFQRESRGRYVKVTQSSKSSESTTPSPESAEQTAE